MRASHSAGPMFLMAALACAACDRHTPPAPIVSDPAKPPAADAQAIARASADGAAAARLLARRVGATRAPDQDVGTGVGADAAAAVAAVTPPSAPPDAQGFVELDWLAMIPPAELEALERGPEIDHSGKKRMRQIGSYTVMPGVLGRPVKLPGYVVPMENDDRGRMTEFFFVPFFGACIHVPAPPPNQIIYVRLAKAMKTPEIWDPYWLKGELLAEKVNSSVAGSAYTMNTAVLEPYDG